MQKVWKPPSTTLPTPYMAIPTFFIFFSEAPAFDNTFDNISTMKYWLNKQKNKLMWQRYMLLLQATLL